jgi:serine protease Do
VSVGVVSGIGREFAIGEHRNQRVIQTDAAINPGNSGGPLLNLRGEVIGINTAIYADQARQGNIGIGFAMPINLVRDVLPQLRTGKITRGRIGIELKDVAPGDVKALNLKSREGALVSSVIEDSAAEKAGVEDGDVILSFNGKPIHRSDDLVSMVTSTKPGTTVPLRVVRKGAERSVNITVDELDYNQENQAKPRERAVAPPDDHETSRGFGLELQNITPDLARRFQLKDTHGAIVSDVDVDGSAAGILFPRDVIVEIGSAAITTAADASRELGRVPSGGTVTMRVMREGRRRFLTLVKE